MAALGLVGTGARLRVLPTLLEGVLVDPQGTAELVTDNTYAPGLDPELRRRARVQFILCPPAVTHGDFVACNTFDVMAQISEIRVPTLVVCGTQDRMTPPKYSQFLASGLPNATLVLIDGAGHMVMVEKPDEVNRALREFLQRLTV